MNYQTHFPTSMLTEDPLQASYIKATLCVTARQMWYLLQRPLYNGASKL